MIGKFGKVYNSLAIMAAKTKTDVSDVTSGITTLEDIALAIVIGIGVVFFCFGIVELGGAISAHDSTQQLSGIKRMIAGIFMIAAPLLIALFT